MDNHITFRANFAPLESAIKISPDGGMRITLDIPESDLAKALYLLELRDKVFVVSITQDTPKQVVLTGRKSKRIVEK